MTTHLTQIPNSTRLAWHSAFDVQAIRTVAGDERLYVNGRHVRLHPRMHGALQTVINFSQAGQSPDVLVAQIAVETDRLNAGG